MRLIRRLVLVSVLAGVGAAGCGNKSDNSKNQTPNDAPIGAPKPIGGGKKDDGGIKGREAPLK